MPSDLTTAEKAERLGLTKCNCCGLWRSSSGAAVLDVDFVYARRFGDGTAPGYRAALEALVIAAARVEAGAHVHYDADRDALLSALTHARKVLHGQ